MTSLLGLARGTTAPSRALLFGLKEVEYFVIFLLVPNIARRQRDVRLAVTALLWTGLANACWVSYQLFTGSRTRLLSVAPELMGAPSYSLSRVTDSYGPGLIGELSPYSVGGFFMIVLLVALARAWLAESARERITCQALGLWFALCLLSAESRANVVGAGIGAVLLALRVGFRRSPRIIGFYALVVAMLMGFAAATEYNLFARMSRENVDSSVSVRSTKIWPIVLSHPWQLLIGYGKGSLGYADDLPIAEAHNHYLRVMVESGALGLVCFLALLFSTLAAAARLSSGALNPLSRAVGAATLSIGAALLSASVFQDAFTAVIPNELFWLLAGLGVAGLRSEAALRRTDLRLVARNAPGQRAGVGGGISCHV
jgi:hypothetical protein